MRRSYRILPVYAGDVSGACSALYELGGMTVMHDPSGCNSTYNTHDELRWYGQDSLIYNSGLAERDAVLGNDRKFTDDVIRTAGRLKPKFIALAGSPIPYLIGTDFRALAEIIERETGIPSFAVPTNGMHDYVSGAGMALESIAERFVVPAIREAGTAGGKAGRVNLLGVTPLDFGPSSTTWELIANLRKYGWETCAVWAEGQTLDDLTRSGEAEVNLVVSSAGMRAAEFMRKTLGVPYVVGTPLGSFTRSVCLSLEAAAGGLRGRPVSYLDGRIEGPADITVIGEPVTAGSVAALMEEKIKRAVRVICPLEEWKGLLAPGDLAVRGEEELEAALSGTKVLLADPLYRPVCPEGCRFAELPHTAFSGRIYAEKLPDILK